MFRFHGESMRCNKSCACSHGVAYQEAGATPAVADEENNNDSYPTLTSFTPMPGTGA